jgi:2-octaprenyl-6-methoxyphenol hydroxylase
MARPSPTVVEVAVVGGGPVGLTAAVALAAAGIETALVGPQLEPDHRTTALLLSSVTALETLGVWERCRSAAAPLRALRIVDDTSRLIRAPEVLFRASEIGQEAFGHNIENRRLTAALEAHAPEMNALVRISERAAAIEPGERAVAIHTSSGSRVEARLAIGADGRDSLCRRSAGIEADARRYPQTAFALNLTHSRHHEHISTEFHTEQGPFTLVPLPDRRSSLVWVTGPHEATRLACLDDGALSVEIERRAHSILGKTTVEPGRGTFALGIVQARRLAGRRIVLIGEAAHMLPPIGAQGLNLGLRDAAAIAELIVAGRRRGADVGSEELLGRYERVRQADVMSRMLAVDLLNRTLLTDFLPMQGARGLSLYLIDRIPPLRRALMREGVFPAAAPRLMRGEPL